jgi:hypothetical protein
VDGRATFATANRAHASCIGRRELKEALVDMRNLDFDCEHFLALVEKEFLAKAISLVHLKHEAAKISKCGLTRADEAAAAFM